MCQSFQRNSTLTSCSADLGTAAPDPNRANLLEAYRTPCLHEGLHQASPMHLFPPPHLSNVFTPTWSTPMSLHSPCHLTGRWGSRQIHGPCLPSQVRHRRKDRGTDQVGSSCGEGRDLVGVDT